MSLKTHAAALPRDLPASRQRPALRVLTASAATLALLIAAVQLWWSGGPIALLVPTSLLLGLAPHFMPAPTDVSPLPNDELADMGLACAIAPLILFLVN